MSRQRFFSQKKSKRKNFWTKMFFSNICLSDSKEFQDAESVRSGHSHVTSQPVSFPPHPVPEGMLSRSFGVPSRREGPPSIWDTQGISGNVFANPDASSSALYPQELNQWNSSREEPLHSSTVEKSERQKQNQDLRCQSGPSAKDSVIFSGGDSSKNMGQTTISCGIYAMDQRSGAG